MRINMAGNRFLIDKTGRVLIYLKAIEIFGMRP